jgi:hypothetical protein
MTIEKLHVMPTHEKVEDGYAYNSKYVGNVYQINDQLVYFKEKSTIDYPMKVIQTIKSDTLEAIDSTLEPMYESIANIEKQLSNLNLSNVEEEVKNYIDSRLNTFDNRIENNIKPELTRIEDLNDAINRISSEISVIKQDLVSKLDLVKTIDKVIDDKLTTVYNNFNSVTKQLVTDAVNNALKDSKRDQTGKLKITTLMMLKEMGLTPDEIIKYTESGLV